MRRTFLSARSSRAVYRAFSGQQPRRTFATPPIKDDSPPSPIEPSKEQAHPIGAFYEAILRTPKPLPKEKPEVPPVTSQEPPVETPEPTPEQQASKAAPEEKSAAPAAEEKASELAQEDKKAARRPRKPRQPAASKDATPSSKAKSVPSSSHSSFSSSTSSTSAPSAPGPALLPQSPPPEASPKVEEEQEEPPSNDVQARARVVFGSRLVGPAERAERLARLRTESRLVAGVLVPPKPEEPDNCCMSGCVNCVWDRYRDEVEDWAAKSTEAERRLQAMEAGEQVGVTEDSMDGVERGRGIELGVHDEVADRAAASMDDDGGGSVGNWETAPSDAATATAAANKDGGGRIVKDFWDEELYKNVPVGIREFMKQEKRLKEKHLREGTVGG